MKLTTLLVAVLSSSFAEAAISNAMLRGKLGILEIPAPERTAAVLSSSSTEAGISNAMLHGRLGIPQIPIPERTVVSKDGTVLPALDTIYHFDQLKDHNNSDLGTFRQRYWFNYEFYESGIPFVPLLLKVVNQTYPGGPIILMTPGEVNAKSDLGYLYNSTINGMIAQQHHGATIVLEHRFFGYSNPYDNLTSESLKLLTIEQAIDDLVYFAQNVDLPMPGGDNVKPDTTPWILIGGSYSGALTAWTMVSKPGVFRAGYASSAVVEPIIDFYGYFTPILEYMPQNCSSDVQAVIAYLDQLYDEDDTASIQDLKDTFGLGNLSHVDDFAAALRLNVFDWQSLQPDNSTGQLFYQFCDALEVKDGVSAPSSGWGLENAIQAWGSFWNDTYYANGKSLCGTTDAEMCLGTYDASQTYWTNVNVNNSDRSWYWLVCNQVGGYQVGPPLGQPAIVSRILQPVYGERKCENFFPGAFSSPPSPLVDEVITTYGGWNLTVDRLFFVNGLRDPWREETVSAEGSNTTNTTTQPIYEGDGFHTSDLSASNGLVDETINATQMAALAFMETWLS